jgi:maltose alpha-D-glucosyltransferase/alpha-amylase
MNRRTAVPRQTTVFRRGTRHFLRPANESVLAHVREHEGEILFAVHNLAGSAQPVELDLRAWRGYTTIEMLGDTRFPTIGDLPYFISLAPYGYYWFRLQPPLSAEPLYGIEASPL